MSDVQTQAVRFLHFLSAMTKTKVVCVAGQVCCGEPMLAVAGQSFIVRHSRYLWSPVEVGACEGYVILKRFQDGTEIKTQPYS